MPETGFLNRTVALPGRNHDYALYVPDAHNCSPTPAILFLHGMGESGVDNVSQLRIGLPAAIREAPDKWPFIVVCPQKPIDIVLWPQFAYMIDAMLRATEAEYNCDPARRYITGLSQGGNGTFVLAKHLIWRFAAAAPVCGWADPMLAGWELHDLPLWAFHGEDDPVVPSSCSASAIDCIRRNGGSPRMSTFPGVAHDCWDNAYKDSGLAEWLLNQHL